MVKNDIIDRLFYTCNSGDLTKEGEEPKDTSLAALCVRYKDAMDTDRAFNEALETLVTDCEANDVIWQANAANVAAYERQGFRNGFRMALMLMQGCQS